MTASGRYSVAFPRKFWYPVCRSEDLGDRPYPFPLMGTPLVAFRDDTGAPAVLFDRCAHRNYPLALGKRTDDGLLQCGYHGWCFDRSGSCVSIPGLEDDAIRVSGAVISHAAAERDGMVWVWGQPDDEPTGDPFPLPAFTEPSGAGEVVFRRDLECTVHAAIENSLDVPHTAFLHGGLFRGGDRHTVTVVRRNLPDGVEAQYIGEPAGMGPIRLSETSGRTFDHWDRFFLPSVAQIEYAIDGWFRLVNTILHLPLSPFRTRAWFIVRYWSRLPSSVVRPVVFGRGLQILKQDEAALARQTDTIQAFGGERYTSTELDVLGNAIWHLLRRAERAESGDTVATEEDGPAPETTVTFDV